jgi:hypothetical protein
LSFWLDELIMESTSTHLIEQSSENQFVVDLQAGRPSLLISADISARTAEGQKCVECDKILSGDWQSSNMSRALAAFITQCCTSCLFATLCLIRSFKRRSLWATSHVHIKSLARRETVEERTTPRNWILRVQPALREMASPRRIDETGWEDVNEQSPAGLQEGLQEGEG